MAIPILCIMVSSYAIFNHIASTIITANALLQKWLSSRASAVIFEIANRITEAPNFLLDRFFLKKTDAKKLAQLLPTTLIEHCSKTKAGHS